MMSRTMGNLTHCQFSQVYWEGERQPASMKNVSFIKIGDWKIIDNTIGRLPNNMTENTTE